MEAPEDLKEEPQEVNPWEQQPQPEEKPENEEAPVEEEQA